MWLYSRKATGGAFGGIVGEPISLAIGINSTEAQPEEGYSVSVVAFLFHKLRLKNKSLVNEKEFAVFRLSVVLVRRQGTP